MISDKVGTQLQKCVLLLQTRTFVKRINEQKGIIT